MHDNYTGPPKAPALESKIKLRLERKYEGLTYQLDGTVDEVIHRLQELKDNTEEGSTLHLNFEKVYGEYGDDDTWEVKLYDERIETDQECRIRMNKEEQAVRTTRALKLAQLAQLKKELGEV